MHCLTVIFHRIWRQTLSNITNKLVVTTDCLKFRISNWRQATRPECRLSAGQAGRQAGRRLSKMSLNWIGPPVVSILGEKCRKIPPKNTFSSRDLVGTVFFLCHTRPQCNISRTRARANFSDVTIRKKIIIPLSDIPLLARNWRFDRLGWRYYNRVLGL
jgi:hypothetical protein